MLAALERNGASGVDAWGNAVAPVFASLGEPVRCFVWSDSASETIDGSKTAQIERLRALFALGTDLLPGDEVAELTDRKGQVTVPGRLRVEGPVQRKHTHLEANLRRIG